MTINVEWTSGSGTLRAAATNGSQVGPVLGDTIAFISTSTLVTAAAHVSTCNRNNTACGYSISVQGDRALSQQAVYTITATTSNWVRTLYTTGPAPSWARAGGGGHRLLARELHVGSRRSTAQLMVAVEVLSGSVTVYGSNMTSEPNATTAQSSWPDLSSTSLLASRPTDRRHQRVLDGSCI